MTVFPRGVVASGDQGLPIQCRRSFWSSTMRMAAITAMRMTAPTSSSGDIAPRPRKARARYCSALIRCQHHVCRGPHMVAATRSQIGGSVSSVDAD